MRGALRRYDSVEDEVDLGVRRVRILRPRSADALLDDATHAGAERAPYWAELWPSARALAALLAARDLTGRRAVELGCGLGLASVGAALGGAEVLATDHEPDALAFAAENGRRALGHRLETMEADFGKPPDELLARAPFDLAIAADVLYEPPSTDALAALLPRLLGPGGEALIAYPWTGQGVPLGELLSLDGWTIASQDLTTTHMDRPFTVHLLLGTR